VSRVDKLYSLFMYKFLYIVFSETLFALYALPFVHSVCDIILHINLLLVDYPHRI